MAITYKLGGNTFVDCSVPLMYKDRLFIIEPGHPLLTSVMIQHDGRPIFEVLKNEPAQNPVSVVSRTPPGIVTVGERGTERFLYKVRPGSETSIVFGKIGDAEMSVRITDREIVVLRGDTPMVTLVNNRFQGQQVGVVVRDDGSIGIGASVPAALQGWFSQQG